MKWKCKKCGIYVSKKNRVSKKFCSNSCKELSKQIFCRFCGRLFKASVLSQRICNECKSNKNKLCRIKYKRTIIEKICKHCKSIFYGTRNTILCNKCKTDLPNPLIHKYDWIYRSVICKKCGRETKKQKIKYSPRTNLISYVKMCSKCKQRKLLSKDLKLLDKVIGTERRKLIQRDKQKSKDLKLLDKVIGTERRKLIQRDKQKSKDLKLLDKVIGTERRKLIQRENKRKKYNEFLLKQERLTQRKKTGHQKTKIRITDEKLLETIRQRNKQNLINRMKNNNPMKNPEVVNKVKNTIKKRILSGVLVYKKGLKHHLYKGNRNFSDDCRKWLVDWRKQILKRDNFSCTGCGICKTEFHIHHIKPLREIVKKVLTEMNITDIVSVKENNISLYEKAIQNVVDNHRLEDGITVCKQCHANIDNRYRRIKKLI